MKKSWMRAALAGGAALTVLAASHSLSAPPADATELRFAQVFKLPVGPRGLELNPEFSALEGRSVRIVGYRVGSVRNERDGFILAPFPVTIGDDDESLSDDLPASALYMQLASENDASEAAGMWGLLAVTGRLHVSTTRASDGRLLPARIDVKTIQRLR